MTHLKTLTASLGFLALTGAFALPAAAGTNDATIPVTITLNGTQATAAPLYVSVQKRSEYQGIKGFGDILKTTTNGSMTFTVNVDMADDYAVSVWHDLDNDGRFSMTENYVVLDGWGNSGAQGLQGRPTFDDVKVNVPASGAAVSVTMKYPAQ